MRIEFAGSTDVGRRRKRNEDFWVAVPDDNLLIVADGMGGHESGDRASRLAAESIQSFFRLTHPDSDNTWPHVAVGDRISLEDYNACRLVSAIQFAHRRICYEVQQSPELAGMGTTIVCVLFANEKAYVAHVGDSRCYCLSGGSLWQVTSDHTLANHVRSRFEVLTEEQEQRLSTLQHVVVRALGGSDTSDAQVDLTVLEPFPGDLFLLCSDGLSGELTDREIKGLLLDADDLQGTTRELVQVANEHGGRDNITAVLVRVAEVGAQPRPNRRVSDRSDDEDTCEDITTV